LALAVVTRTGVTSISARARVKKAGAAAAVRRSEKEASMTGPASSIAR
jgi:hypothetical protein